MPDFNDTKSYTTVEDTELQDIKQQYREYQSINPNLCRQLRSLGLGEVMLVKIIDRFTIVHAYDIIFKENPYRLMDIEGFGFTKADNIGRQLGIQSEDPRRQKALIQSILETHKSFGHCFLHNTILEKECKKQGVNKFNEMLKEMIDNEEVVLEVNRIYLKKLYVAECETAQMIKEILEYTTANT